MTLLADLLSSVFERRYALGPRCTVDDRPFEALTADLIGAAGEVSGVNVARTILDRYAAADDAEKLRFFRHLADDMTISPALAVTRSRPMRRARPRRATAPSWPPPNRRGRS
jgi:malonyl-CoA decarboxylase